MAVLTPAQWKIQLKLEKLADHNCTLILVARKLPRGSQYRRWLADIIRDNRKQAEEIIGAGLAPSWERKTIRFAEFMEAMNAMDGK